MYKKLVILPLFILLTTFLYSEGDLQITIRYHNKTIYYPNKSIPVKLFVQNNSTTSKTFDIADQRSYNVDFYVETLKKERLPHREKFIIARNTNQPVFLREVRLEPGDEYNFIVDLAQYIIIDEPGLYRVTATFKDNLKSNNSNLKSNTLILSVREGEGLTEDSYYKEKVTKEILKKTGLSPDEVVNYTILARQKSQWNKFFLYLDLENIYINDEYRERKYKRSTEEERISLLENFKNSLINGNVETGIINIPYSFEITNTNYTPTTAQVVVYKKFKFPDYMENKKYIYHLSKIDMVWYITEYEVINLGTE